MNSTWGISILADLRPGVRFQAVAVFGLGKNLLFKSVLGHCTVAYLFGGLETSEASK